MALDIELLDAVARLDIARLSGLFIATTVLAVPEVVLLTMTALRSFAFAVSAAFADTLMMFCRFTVQGVLGEQLLIIVSHLQA
jgi:hypothetical protein